MHRISAYSISAREGIKAKPNLQFYFGLHSKFTWCKLSCRLGLFHSALTAIVRLPVTSLLLRLPVTSLLLSVHFAIFHMITSCDVVPCDIRLCTPDFENWSLERPPRAQRDHLRSLQHFDVIEGFRPGRWKAPVSKSEIDWGGGANAGHGKYLLDVD